ncbi:MAG: ABC transporter ATP-binding protein [Calditrichaeota bacterium]|nr:ABC transporter ATP-binding protein [Calditrichota bacterium]
MPIAIDCLHVTKTYRGQDRPALDGVTFQIKQGQRVGLMGANGSGKSTLLKLILNFLRPDAGTIRVLQQENLEDARRFLGYVSEHQVGLENFTPRELFGFAARMYALPPQQAVERRDALLAFSGLKDVADDLVEGFSKGMVQRLQIALAIYHDPPILLLDEPLSGLDPQGQAEVREMLARINGRTILLATHQLDEIETFCDAGIILHQGRVRAILDLKAEKREIYQITVASSIRPLLGQFEALQPRIIREEPDRVTLQFQATPDTFQEFLHRCQQQNITVYRIRSRGILEDLYLRYVQGNAETPSP